MRRNGAIAGAIQIDMATANSFEHAADKLSNSKTNALAGIDGNRLLPMCQGQDDLSID